MNDLESYLWKNTPRKPFNPLRKEDRWVVIGVGGAVAFLLFALYATSLS